VLGPGELELEQKLQIKHGQSVAVVNAPPESGLRLRTAGDRNPDRADVVIGFAVRPADLAWLRPVHAAARAGRLAWVSVDAVQDVSINGTWSALRLRPAKDDHQPDTSTANKGSK
jgi:hypothetical protein